MSCCRHFKRINLPCITCKIFGVLTISFCFGTVVGMFMPLGVVAVIETSLLLLLAYLCLFKW